MNQEMHAALQTTNLRIAGFEDVAAPQDLQERFPLTPKAAQVVLEGREAIRRAIAGEDKRLIVVVGPCSIHDPEAAREYARRLIDLRDRVCASLLIVMRVYFEKPRTTLGWKGFINDPHLDGTCDINQGLLEARKLLLELNEIGLPCASEFLDPIVPQFTADLVAWAAIGARTTESQTHREMASGLSMPVGFKNATDGSLQIAINGMVAARQPHAFLGITPAGKICVVRTQGNPDVHLVLRGGEQPNFTKPHIAFAKASLEQLPEQRLIMVDCSHGNSSKDHRQQSVVFDALVAQRAAGEEAILGMMVESHLVEGKQSIGSKMIFGQSVTDACMGWEETRSMLLNAHAQLLNG